MITQAPDGDAPAWPVRIGAPLLTRTDPERAIDGRYGVPTRLMAQGFAFEVAQLTQALRASGGNPVDS